MPNQVVQPKRATSWTPPPPATSATNDVEFKISEGGVRHVPDPDGLGRRYFEGWASLKGLDYLDTELPPEAFVKGAQEYLTKNPVICWSHKPNLPIGTVLSLTFTEEGLYMTGYIHDQSDLLKAFKKAKKKAPPDSIAVKCEEAWKGIKKGWYKGLSVRASVRALEKVESSELGKKVIRFLELLILEISVCPIQMHPGAKITAVDTLARGLPQEQSTTTLEQAIEIVRGLPALPQEEEPMDVQEAWKKFQESLQANSKDGQVELPEEIARGIQGLSGAISDDAGDQGGDGNGKGDDGGGNEDPEKPPRKEPPSQADLQAMMSEAVRGAFEEHVKPLREELDQLKGKRAPRKSVISIKTPEGSTARPDGAPTKHGAIRRCLGEASRTYNGLTEMGKGEIFGLSLLDVTKLCLLDAGQQGKLKVGGSVNLSRRGREYFARIQSQSG